MSVDELTGTSVEALQVGPSSDDPARRRITLERLRGPVTWWCLVAAALAAVGYALGTVVAGRLAVRPTGWLVALLAVLVVGGVSTSGNAAVTKTGTPTTTNDPLASLSTPSLAGLSNYGNVSVTGSHSP